MGGRFPEADVVLEFRNEVRASDVEEAAGGQRDQVRRVIFDVRADDERKDRAQERREGGEEVESQRPADGEAAVVMVRQLA